MNGKPVPFFIVGCARSGTTLLRVMLDSHSRLAIPPESQRIAQILRSMGGTNSPLDDDGKRRATALILAMVKERRYNMPLDELEGRLLSLRSPRLSELLDTTFREYARFHGKVRWGDKTPRYVHELKTLNQLFPDCLVVHMIRDGRDVMLSQIRVWGYKTARSAAKAWVKAIQAGRAFARKHPNRYYEVRYEDLVRNPKGELRGLAEFLCETPEDNMIRYQEAVDSRFPQADRGWHGELRRAPHTSRLGRWRSELSPSWVLVFELCAGQTLSECGYELMHANPGRWDRFRAGIISAAHVARWTLFCAKVRAATVYRWVRPKEGNRARSGRDAPSSLRSPRSLR